MIAGQKLPVGPGYATVLPDFDFETYSEAGYTFDEAAQKWRSIKKSPPHGLGAVGGAVYAEHPSTEVLSLAYNLKDGLGSRLWVPGMPLPEDLFTHIATGGLLEAWHCEFEYNIWAKVCVARMGWPPLPLSQLRDAMVKARAWTLPGRLAKSAEVLGTEAQKLADGTRLLNKFSKPRNPTKKDKRTRIRPTDPDALEDGSRLYGYNLGDIDAEAACSERIPDLLPEELQFWQLTAESNVRGVGIDRKGYTDCIAILEQANVRYNEELRTITEGAVPEASKVQALLAWVATRGLVLPNLDDDMISTTLKRPDLPPDVRRVLEIRQLIGSAGVKKVYAMQNQTTEAGRVCGMFIYHGARTGRDTGADVQPQNLVKAGPDLRWCEDSTCGKPYAQALPTCPHCGTDAAFSRATGWDADAVPYVLEAMATQSLDYVEFIFGNAVLAVSGCIRGMFIAAPGKDLVCSDYSSIEAVVTAVLSGEEWRIEAFRQKQDIYLVSAARITGKTYDFYIQYKEEHGHHHSDRQKIGKPAELGLGFGGWLMAWRQFDKTDNFSDDDVKRNILTWRDVSPAIVEMWGGQVRGKPWRPERFELYGLEGAAISAVMNPGQAFAYRSLTYQVKDDALYCRLPSGRLLTYHRPRLSPSTRWEGQQELTFEGWNSNPKMGPIGWIRIQTYGGRLMENVVQAVARDIMRDAVIRLEAADYPIVLRVHDELVAEVPEGWGSVEEFEAIMATMPAWAAGWPIRAAGGWRKKRYRKD